MFGDLFNLDVGFNKPWYLLLLALLPALWFLSFKSLSGLGKVRRLIALSLRTIVVAAVILALAEIQLLKTSDKVTVLYLLDQSQSIPVAKRQAMLQYVVKEVAKHRNAEREDRAGVIVFGKEALIEIPPFADDVPSISSIESGIHLETDATNLAAALKLAQATFPEDSAKRVVVVTDGNENLGNARSVAPMLRDAGIGIDVVPVELNASGEVAVEKIVLPPDIRRGQPIDARVVLNNFAGKPVQGKLKITRLIGAQEELLDEPTVQLKPGKNVFSFEHTIDDPAVYTYRADFTADKPGEDLLRQNNTATAFTHVRGKGRVLLIEDWEHKGDFDLMTRRLRANNLEVTVMPSDELFTSLAELQSYDCVVLANVPRSSGEDSKTVTNFSDDQIDMLVRNTQQMGAGLVMLGGPNSFGAGGWANTEIEKAMPVYFQFMIAIVLAVGALALLMHASEMAQGNHWQKVVAKESIKALGPMDYCGLLHWGNTTGADEWLWGGNQGLVRVGGKRKMMIGRLSRMTPGDMPQFEPAMKVALGAFRRVNASVKHMIIISDGDPSPPRGATIAAYKQAKIQISTVAVGTHGPPGSTPLQQLATQTGGKYYVVSNPKALPKIYQREARRVARPLIYEPDGGVRPQVVYDHEMHDFAINEQLPPISGFVLTTLKENALVEQSIVSPKPIDSSNASILASWTYGLGRSAVLTTDAGKRWTASWTDWEDYDKFYVQLIRWAMRPVDEDGKF
ncbi:MAG: VWA domain-containing protein, partial [Pirellulaceae bacterium]|nr:VWA domain-containing protein [Pirellulaceae bacterium]